MTTWIASLSNGQQLSMRELNNGDGTNPWDKVVNYIRKNDLQITHLQLIVNGKVYNSPSLSRNASFRSNTSIDKFWIFYKHAANLAGDQQSENYIAFSYRIGDFRNFFWVNTHNNFCYTQILNVVDPSTREEEAFVSTEGFIEEAYTCLQPSF